MPDEALLRVRHSVADSNNYCLQTAPAGEPTASMFPKGNGRLHCGNAYWPTSPSPSRLHDSLFCRMSMARPEMRLQIRTRRSIYRRDNSANSRTLAGWLVFGGRKGQ